MENKKTAIDWLAEQIKLTNKEVYAELQKAIEEAKEMEKEQMIKFAQIVIDNTCGDYDGIVVILKPIEDIYNETYKQKENE